MQKVRFNTGEVDMNDEVKPDFREAKKKTKVKKPWIIESKCSYPLALPRTRVWHEHKCFETKEKREDYWKYVQSDHYDKTWYEYRKIDPERK